jgi:hypothetical protein
MSMCAWHFVLNVRIAAISPMARIDTDRLFFFDFSDLIPDAE